MQFYLVLVVSQFLSINHMIDFANDGNSFYPIIDSRLRGISEKASNKEAFLFNCSGPRLDGSRFGSVPC